MTFPSRRSLLRGAVGTGVLSAFGAPIIRRARGSVGETKDRYFIFAYFNGGWDLLLGLDPRDPTIFRDDLRKVTLIDTGYSALPAGYQNPVATNVSGMTFGPYIGDLARHADKLCVVRGMSMDTLTHEVGRRRYLTGRAPSGLQAQGSSLSTLLASYLGKNEPVPQLSVRVESYNADQPSYANAIRVASVSDLVRALRPGADALVDVEKAAVDALLYQTGRCENVHRSDFFRSSLEFRSAAQELVALGLDDVFDFGAYTDEMEALRDRYGISTYDLTSPNAQAAAAVRAITSGISRTVCMEAARDLDTHGPEWASSQGPRIQSGFNLIAAMIDELSSLPYGDSGESWLDVTTIVAFSEFGRSTLLNSSGGRDHNIHNACLLVGGGVRSGVVLGGTSDLGMAPVAMDLATGVPNATSGTVVKPEHIFRAILTDVGITEDIGDYRAEPLTAIYG